MNDPISTTTATTTAATTVVAAPLLGIDPLIAIGAITGAGIFILNEQGHSKLKAVFLFAIAVICGCFGASLAANVVMLFMPGTVSVSHGVGAIVASAISVKLLQKLLTLIESHTLQNLLRGRPK